MWLGIDIGTGSSRALVVNHAGQIVAAHSVAHEDIQMDHPLWAEQRPENWWDAASEAVRGALAGIDASEILAVGLSGQMHGLVALDAAHRVLRPSLIWCDQRSQPQVDWVNATVGKERVLQSIANPVLTGFTLPKLLWVRDNEPDIYERIRKVLLPKDYVRFRLTGEFATEVSDASGTALFDVVNRRWSFELADAVGVDRTFLPPCFESGRISATISAQGAAATGLKPGTPVVGGAGDQAASAVGNGIVQPGLVSCTLGTSGVVFAHMDRAAYDPAGRVHTFCHAVEGKWHAMGVTQGAGLSLQWFRNRLAPEADYDALMSEAASAPAGSQGLYWLPYLMGERTPHLDSLARGGWIGLTAKQGRAELLRSLIEGVSYSMKDCLGIVESLGAEVESVRVSGGGARSPFWRQVLADVFDKPVVTLKSHEGSALGAALIAMMGTGHYTAAAEENEEAEPEPSAVAAYARGYNVYRSLYPALRPLYGDM